MTSEHENDCVSGKRVRFSDCKAVYFVDNRILRHIPDTKTYNNLFAEWNDIVEEKEPGPWCSFGKPICPGACLKQNEADGQIYLVEGTVKRPIPDAFINKLHFACDKIERVSSDSLAELIDGLPVFPDP